MFCCVIAWLNIIPHFHLQTGLLESAVFKLQLNSEPFLAGGEHIDNRTAAAANSGCVKFAEVIQVCPQLRPESHLGEFIL